MAASGEPDRQGPEIRILVISGPTCSGKSSLAITIAGEFNAEIISADSRQIFRQPKIGTDRLDKDQWGGVPHHLTGTVDLGQRFTVFDFVREAEAVIKQVHARGKRVIICGGTGLYTRALIDGIFEIPEDDLSYRRELIDLAAKEGPVYIHNMLKAVDSEEAAAIHPHNVVKSIRALEIYHITGRAKSELAEETEPKNRDLKSLHIILLPDRDKLYKLIEDRVDRMIDVGLVDEAEGIFKSSFGEGLFQNKIVGYSELIDYFKGQSSLPEAINMIKQNTRRYAKRQYTWFRGVKKARKIYRFGLESTDICRGLAETFWA
jgi:tRNA dimethylallyltransferase